MVFDIDKIAVLKNIQVDVTIEKYSLKICVDHWNYTEQIYFYLN